MRSGKNRASRSAERRRALRAGAPLRPPAIKPRLGHGSAGRLVDVRFYSRVLGCWRHYTVWVPPGYSRSSARLPVVYLFRGHHTEWQRQYRPGASFRLFREAPPLRMMDIARVMETIVRAGHSRPVLLVTPCMSNDDGSTTGLATDWASPHLITGKRARGVGTGRYHEHLFEELIPDVERRFRTMSDKYGRATDGFSLGGFMALKTALARPDLFCAAGAYDGSFFYLHHRPGGMESGDYLMDNGLFDPVFGQPRRMEHVWRNSPAAILSQLSDAELRSLSFYLQCGPQQAEPMDSNFYRTMHMVRLLQMRGLNNRAEPCVFEDGHHDWPTAFRHLAGALEHFSSIFT